MNERPAPLGRARLAGLGLLAAALHAVFDVATAQLPATTPPYLRTADMPEAFQALSPVAVGIATSCVSGIIAVIALIATEHARRRALALGAAVTGFWLFSAVLMTFVWLDTPWPVAAVALAAGVPRGFAIGAVLAALAGRPERAAAPTLGPR
ncbi:hypothetical protein [Anaeromyxobacter diazotrophicus]|uniref:Major facilitator superfamily (MFS) profile domain-containing protein n=1 Tax=Anaeromyxobacter diazotrophicus TaxID=2590199 RepID=A0A7I9VK79_9BACT|nr:hypothetical protein [Anaeromyxobacter diazotrophicus]GEJ56417.1 hypothetical protein AMYX_11580 [Anaeromyxobacter diazotrophicus]